MSGAFDGMAARFHYRLTAVVFAAAMGFAGMLPAAEAVRTRSCCLPLSADGTFVLSNVNGRVDIDTWDENSVVLDYRMVIEDTTEAGAKKWLDKIRVDIRQVSVDRVEVETILPQSDEWGFLSSLFEERPKARVEYRVRVPSAAAVKVKSVNGPLSINGPGGPVSAESVNGIIRIPNGGSRIHAATVNGTVEAELVTLDRIDTTIPWAVRMSSVHGALSLLLPSDAEFTLKASTMNGRITGDFHIPVETGIVGRTADVAIGGGGKTIVLETVNGPIRVKKIE